MTESCHSRTLSGTAPQSVAEEEWQSENCLVKLSHSALPTSVYCSLRTGRQEGLPKHWQPEKGACVHTFERQQGRCQSGDKESLTSNGGAW